MAHYHESNDGDETNNIDDTDARMKIQGMIDDLRCKCLISYTLLLLF